jgi:ABC-type transporter Mla subunit MlaD
MIYKFGELPATISRLGSFQVFVQFPTATGVQKDTPVRFCGYQIGRVIEVMPPMLKTDLNTGLEYHQTVVVLSIDKKYCNIPCEVDVKLMTRGLGSSYIELKAPPELYDPNRAGEKKFLCDKTLLQGSTGMTSEFFPEESQKKLQELVDGLRTLVDNTNDIIGDPENRQNLKSILANLTEATNEAAVALRDFQRLSAAGAVTLENADLKLERLVTSIIDTGAELTKTAAQLRLVLEKVNDGQGTAARFVNDGKFYENLLENTEQLQLLVQEIKAFVTQTREKGLRVKLK